MISFSGFEVGLLLVKNIYLNQSVIRLKLKPLMLASFNVVFQ